MRWLAYFILAYIMLGLQLGLGAQLRYRGAAPDLVLLVVIFISLNAPRDEAMLGSFLLGAMKDLVTLQPMGLYALSYGIVAMVVSAAGQLAYREHPLTHLMMTFLGGLVTAVILLVHGRIHPVGPAQNDNGVLLPAVRILGRILFLIVIYTTLLGPVVLGILQRMAAVFAFDPSNRRRNRG